jgi:hypothetical protein
MTLGGMAVAGFYGDEFGSILLLNGQGGMYICAGLLAVLFLWGARKAIKPVAEPAQSAEAASIPA